jgi:hypothetical protein
MSSYTVSAEDAAQLSQAAHKLYQAMQKTDATLKEMAEKAEEIASEYHPVKAAITAAISELSSPAARQYYVNRAQQDLQTAFVLIVQFGCLAYTLGAQCRQWLEDLEQSAQAEPALVTLKALPSAAESIPLCLPSFTPIALLSAGIDKPRRLPANWVGETVLITPAPKAPRTRKPAAKAPAKGKNRKTPVTV